MMSIIGRDYELEHLDEQFQRSQATFLIVYGRRRVGKTYLLIHWMQSRNVPGFYWVATQTSPDLLLASFSAAVHRYITGEEDAEAAIYPSWEAALERLARTLEKQKTKAAIILDEFTYAFESDSSLASVLQKMWDHRFKDLPIFLVISGSHIGMMERATLTYRAPLYGRATGRLKLPPLPFKRLAEFFPNYGITERVAIYAVLGGIPFYLARFNPDWSVSDNIKRRVIESVNVLQEEPRLLLHEQLQEPRMYMGILEAISFGKNVLSEIALEVGEDRSPTSKYLSTLVNLGLVRREAPITIRYREQSRQGRYVIEDPYLRFYFRFIHRKLSQIAVRKIEEVVANIREHMIGYVGRYAFEDLCRQWTLLAGAEGQLPFSPEEIGAHWSRKEQIDVAAINWRTRDLLLGECKWGASKPLDIDVVDKLVARAENVKPKDANKKPFRKHYAFFARAGFTPDALVRIEQIGGLAVDMDWFEEVHNLAVG